MLLVAKIGILWNMKVSSTKSFTYSVIAALTIIITFIAIFYLYQLQMQQTASIPSSPKPTSQAPECGTKTWPPINQGAFSGSRIGKIIQIGRQRMIENLQAGLDCWSEYNNGEFSIIYTSYDKIETAPNEKHITDQEELKNTTTLLSILPTDVLLRTTTTPFADVVAYESTHMIAEDHPIQSVTKKNVTAFGKPAIELTLIFGEEEVVVKLIVPHGNKVYIFYWLPDMKTGELDGRMVNLATFQFEN